MRDLQIFRGTQFRARLHVSCRDPAKPLNLAESKIRTQSFTLVMGVNIVAAALGTSFVSSRAKKEILFLLLRTTRPITRDKFHPALLASSYPLPASKPANPRHFRTPKTLILVAHAAVAIDNDLRRTWPR